MKLEPEIIKHYENALKDILNDCQDGGPAQSYYLYLQKHWTDLPLDRYRTVYRSRFEYLADFVKKRFYEIMREQFIDK